jgi:uncharacterized protein
MTVWLRSSLLGANDRFYFMPTFSIQFMARPEKGSGYPREAFLPKPTLRLTAYGRLRQKCFLLLSFALPHNYSIPMKLLRLLSLYAALALLLGGGIIPYAYRFHCLILLCFLMILYARYRKFTLKDLGFRYDTLQKSLFWNSVLSLFIVTAILLAYHFNLIRTATIPDWSWFFLFYIFISSPAQEFLYRSIVFAELAASPIRNTTATVLISALNFSLLHLLYHDVLTLFVTFIMGSVWGIIYVKYPNFWGVALSHAVVGTVSIFVGLI